MNKNCENCFSPYMDDRKKITYQGMEFCDIYCFINSKYFNIDDIEQIQDLKRDLEKEEEEHEKTTKELKKIENKYILYLLILIIFANHMMIASRPEMSHWMKH